MPRPRKPTNVLELNGSLAKHPDRARERVGEPQDDRALGPPRDGMEPDARAAWLDRIEANALDEIEQDPELLASAAHRLHQVEALLVAHLRWLHPFPSNLGDVLRRYPKVLIPEMNLGQLAMLVRARFLVDARSYSKVQGLPIFAEELEQEILRMLDA